MSNPYKLWESKHISSLDELKHMYDTFLDDNPAIGGGDTETTGLHIIKDKAFLIVFGWLVPNENFGRVYTFNPTQDNMKVFIHLAKKLKLFVWWNTKFDLHMLKNTGWEYNGDNLCEGMAIARATVEAIPAREGGDSLALKSIGKKYVHWKAGDSEALVKDELKKLNNERVKVLTAALKQFNHPYETEYKPIRLDNEKKTTSSYARNNPENIEWRTLKKKWNKGLVEEFLKDISQDIEDLPKEVREVWLEWQKEYPEPTYADVDRNVMIKYAGEDVITMLEYVKKSIPVINARNQWGVIKREMRLIKPLYRMERVGMKVDRDYLFSCRKQLKAYIIQQRKKMYDLAGGKVNVGQDQTILKVFKEKWNIHLENCDKSALKGIMKNYEGEPKRYAELIKELRTLEKWYSTYVNRILELSSYDGRAYTMIHQCSAVSGRVGSDFQQFPKKELKDENGKEIFHPRKAFVTDSGYKWYFLDFSQIELRNQANYTLLVSGGDLNLCRAYMPFKCYLNGEEFNYKDPKHRKLWKLEGWRTEEGDEWTPTDVHGETTKKAFPQINPESDEFAEWRSKGKIFNFMRNYGGGKGAAMKQLDLAEEHADALVRGYSEAFPHVIVYQDAVIKKHRQNGYVENMYGRRYYLKDTNRGYKLANYLVQGTCADMLKECIIAVDEFLSDKKSKFVMNIHDELSFLVVKGEEWVISELKKIMEYHDWHLVPIVADIEVSEGAWSEKVEVKL